MRAVADVVAAIRYGVPHVECYEAADLIEQLDALRPPCPTCGGTPHIPDGFVHHCPDCVDGKVSWEQMAATYRAVWSASLEMWQRSSGIDAFAYLRNVEP